MNEDKVNPKHYNKYEYQPVDFIEDIFEDSCSFLVGNAIKYIARHEDKGGVVDLQKAMFFISRVESTPLVDIKLVMKFTEQLKRREATIIENIFISLGKAKEGLQKFINNYDKYLEDGTK